ncbi:MAG: GNAT family N-acetyltransferase [Phocaeicola sp.]
MFALKPYAHSEYETYYALAVELFTHTYQEILTPEQIAYMLPMMYSKEAVKGAIQKGSSLFIAYYAGKMCGYLHLEPRSSTEMILQKIYLHPSLQGKGVGRKLIEFAFDFTREKLGVDAIIELYVNRTNPAVDFYQHIGFEVMGERDHSIGNGYYMNDYILHYKL